MNEVTVASFSFLHEAEYAKGFLEDAGIWCFLKPDNAAGGAPYIGGLAGASLAVAADDLDQSVEVLLTAGILGEETEDLRALRAELQVRRSLPPALRADLADVERALRLARKKEVRHFVWATFGVSPAALIPFLGLALEDEGGLLAVLCLLVVIVEGWRWVKARNEVRRLEGTLEELHGEAEKSTGD